MKLISFSRRTAESSFFTSLRLVQKERLRRGATVDAYLDPFGGEKLYEMFACTVAQKNGCTVTDLNGEEFDPVRYLKIFEDDRKFIYYPVAARHGGLHSQILDALK